MQGGEGGRDLWWGESRIRQRERERERARSWRPNMQFGSEKRREFLEILGNQSRWLLGGFKEVGPQALGLLVWALTVHLSLTPWRQHWYQPRGNQEGLDNSSNKGNGVDLQSLNIPRAGCMCKTLETFTGSCEARREPQIWISCQVSKLRPGIGLKQMKLLWHVLPFWD